MASQALSPEQIAATIKRKRKEKKISQKQLAELIDKTERTVQNYESGQTDFSMSIIKDIAIALDIDFRELLSTPDHQDGMNVGIDGRNSYRNKYMLESFADVINVLFKIQETYDFSMKLDIAKPPEDKEWKASISVDGKGASKYDMDFCLFLENWKAKMDQLYNGKLSIDRYMDWQAEAIAYYASSTLTPMFERPDLEEYTSELGNQVYRWKNPFATADDKDK